MSHKIPNLILDSIPHKLLNGMKQLTLQKSVLKGTFICNKIKFKKEIKRESRVAETGKSIF